MLVDGTNITRFPVWILGTSIVCCCGINCGYGPNVGVVFFRFGLGKVHEVLKNAPPPAAAVPPEGGEEGEGNATMTEDDIPLQYPVDLTEPLYRLVTCPTSGDGQGVDNHVIGRVWTIM